MKRLKNLIEKSHERQIPFSEIAHLSVDSLSFATALRGGHGGGGFQFSNKLQDLGLESEYSHIAEPDEDSCQLLCCRTTQEQLIAELSEVSSCQQYVPLVIVMFLIFRGRN